mmetsp:Transcript_1192/g.1840  ORF Transcript_1192/g.1840 Transcript_1192/m.1840 type:complete len:203 (+) Transcript_1192:34-642(+)
MLTTLMSTHAGTHQHPMVEHTTESQHHHSPFSLSSSSIPCSDLRSSGLLKRSIRASPDISPVGLSPSPGALVEDASSFFSEDGAPSAFSEAAADVSTGGATEGAEVSVPVGLEVSPSDAGASPSAVAFVTSAAFALSAAVAMPCADGLAVITPSKQFLGSGEGAPEASRAARSPDASPTGGTMYRESFASKFATPARALAPK